MDCTLNCKQNKPFLLEVTFYHSNSESKFYSSMLKEVHTLILELCEYAVSHDHGVYRRKRGYRPYSIESNLDYLSGDPLNNPCLWKLKAFPSKSQGNVTECEMISMGIPSHGYPTGGTCSMKHMKT